MVPTPSNVSHKAIAFPSFDFCTCRLARVSAAGGIADSPMAVMILTRRETAKKEVPVLSLSSQPEPRLPRAHTVEPANRNLRAPSLPMYRPMIGVKTRVVMKTLPKTIPDWVTETPLVRASPG